MINKISIPIISNNKGFNNSWKPRILFSSNNFYNLNYGIEDNLLQDASCFTTFNTCSNNGYYGSADSHVALFNNEYSYIDTSENSNRTLYNEFYKKETENKLSDNAFLLKCKINLSETDILDFKWNDIIKIKDENIGDAFYRINLINYKTDGFSDIELVKINEYFDNSNVSIPNKLVTFTNATETGKSSGSGASGGTTGGSGGVSLEYVDGSLLTRDIAIDLKAPINRPQFTNDISVMLSTGDTGMTFYWNNVPGTKIDDNQIGITSDSDFYINTFTTGNGNVHIGKSGDGTVTVNNDLRVLGDVSVVGNLYQGNSLLVNKTYVDGSLASLDASIESLYDGKVSKTGDTMTGKLILSGHGSQKLMMSYSSIGFAPVADSTTGNLVLGQWEDYFLDLTNGASGSSADATVFRINANTNTGKEATLALVRGEYPNIEFLDFYNNGYTDSSNYGIRIQKRGTGEYRDFRIDQYDGTTRNPLMMIKTNGDIGIGTNYPDYKLDVSGNFRAKSGNITGNLAVNSLDINIPNEIATDYMLYYNPATSEVTFADAPYSMSKSYVDSSLSARDISIDWLNANKLNKSGGTVTGILNVDMLTITGPNNNSTEYILYYDIASGEVTYADAPTGNVTKTYVDSSLAKRDTSIAWLNSNKLNITGGTLTGSLLVTDNVTMDRLYLALPAQNTTNYVLYYSDIDGQVYYDNKPVIDVTKSYVDGSLSTRDTSINWLKTNKLNTTGGTLSGVLNGTSSHWTGDVSVVGNLYQGGHIVATKSYVDASLSAKADKDANISYKTSTYILQPADNNFIIEASGTFSIYLPTGVQFPIGFQATIVNVGGGTIAINASTGATVFSRDSSNDLRKTWSGATVYKRSSTQWVAMGDLQ